MLHQTKWIGLSLALHLTVAAGLTVVAARNAERTPKTIMVLLDSLDSPDLSPLPTRQGAVRPVVRATVPDRPAVPAATKPETATSKPLPHALQPVMPSSTTPSQSPKQNQDKPVSKIVPEQITAVSNQSTPVSSIQQPAQAAASEGRPPQEKAQQRYLKEHFIYIRDLITKQLVYPPMARKMGWSGKTVVTFIITEDGTVHNIRVTESSGFTILDKNAVETVRTVAPFPRPPVRAEIVVPINFKMMQ